MKELEKWFRDNCKDVGHGYYAEILRLISQSERQVDEKLVEELKSKLREIYSLGYPNYWRELDKIIPQFVQEIQKPRKVNEKWIDNLIKKRLDKFWSKEMIGLEVPFPIEEFEHEVRSIISEIKSRFVLEIQKPRITKEFVDMLRDRLMAIPIREYFTPNKRKVIAEEITNMFVKYGCEVEK